MARQTADGTTIARQNDNSPQTYDPIVQVVSIGTVGQTRGLLDTTNLASTSREYLKTIPDGDEIEFLMQYDPDDTTHAALRADVAQAAARSFRISLPNSPAETITFNAQVLAFGITNIEIDNVLGYRCVLKPTGDLTFA